MLATAFVDEYQSNANDASSASSEKVSVVYFFVCLFNSPQTAKVIRVRIRCGSSFEVIPGACMLACVE